MNCPKCGCEHDDGAETCPGCLTSLRFARRAGSARSSRAKLVRLLCACDGLLEIVEGCLGERWACDGRRLVDTKAWCEFYLAHRAVQDSAGTGERSPNEKADR